MAHAGSYSKRFDARQSMCDVQSEWRKQVAIADRTTDGDGTYEEEHKEITRSHWKNPETVQICNNKECGKKFSLIERKHHCRRCGQVFCNVCLQYKRKLNLLAHPDPYGKQYKVCKNCFALGQNEEGASRNLTEFFLRLKVYAEHVKEVGTNREAKMWRSKQIFSKECQRLIDGFKSRIGSSEMKRTFHEMTTMVSTPEWQKSSTWLQENMAENCQFCVTKLGSLMNKKLNCKVCGRVVCKKCSSKDLLLYIPNEQIKTKGDVQPKLAIIRIIGCPEQEPEIALYLRICPTCQEKLVKQQVNAVEEVENTEGGDIMAQLVSCHQKCTEIGTKLDSQLNEYQTVIESLEDNSRAGKSGRSNIKVLAKAQMDVADFLLQLVSKIQLLKQMKPETNTQAVLLKNCLKSKCDYYQETMYTYRTLTRVLGESVPQDVLKAVQQTVDKNAIVSAELYVRQLIFESLHICDKHKLKEEVPEQLSSLDEVIEKEAKTCVQADGEDWEEHVACMSQMVKEQIQGHRLVKLSRQQLKLHGATHAETMLFNRAIETLQQIILQLDIKATDRSFKQSKATLKQTLSNVQQMKN